MLFILNFSLVLFFPGVQPTLLTTPHYSSHKKGVSCNSLSLRSLLEEMRLGLIVRNWRIQRIFKIRMKSRSFSLQTRRKNTHQSLFENLLFTFLYETCIWWTKISHACIPRTLLKLNPGTFQMLVSDVCLLLESENDREAVFLFAKWNALKSM